MQEVEVSVVIPNYNGMAYLDGVLSSLECQTFRDFEVILVDNGSADGSTSFAAASYPWVRVIELPDNYGFSRAVNEGIKASAAEYVLLLNNDTEVEKDFVNEMLSAIKRHSNAFSCAGKMVQFNDRDKLDDAGNYYCALGWAFARGKGKSILMIRRSRCLLPVPELPFTEGNSWIRPDILMKSILHIWRIWMCATVQGSWAMRTGMYQRQWSTM